MSEHADTVRASLEGAGCYTCECQAALAALVAERDTLAAERDAAVRDWQQYVHEVEDEKARADGAEVRAGLAIVGRRETEARAARLAEALNAMIEEHRDRKHAAIEAEDTFKAAAEMGAERALVAAARALAGFAGGTGDTP